MSTFQRSQPACKFFQAGNCNNGPGCPFAHIRMTTAAPAPSFGARPRESCKFWASGGCTKGTACTFAHTNAAPAPRATAPPPMAAATAALGNICRFHAQGTCRAGTQCQFSHDLPLSVGVHELAPNVPPPPIAQSQWLRAPCKFFQQGRCTAIHCPFEHLAPAQSPTRTPMNVAIPLRVDVPSFIPSRNQEPPRPSQPYEPPTQPHGHPQPRSPAVAEPFQENNGSRDAEGDSNLPEWIPVPDTNVRVRYGAGAAIQEVMTAFDSTRVRIDGLPPATTEADLRVPLNALDEGYELTFASITAGTATRSAIVELRTCDAAQITAAALDGQTFRTAGGTRAVISVQVLARLGERGAANLKSNTLRLQWHAPSRLAYAHYRSIARAKEQAQRLNGQAFDGRKITAVYQQPDLRYHGAPQNYSVVLGNIAIGATAEHLRRFCRTEDVDLAKPSYQEVIGINMLYAELERFGRLESFEKQPHFREATKFKALARFATPEAAENAMQGLHQKKQVFLGRSPLWIERVYSVKYAVQRRQYAALKVDLDRLAAIDETSAKLRVYDVEGTERVVVRVYSTEPKPLGTLKAMVEKLLQGDACTNGDGSILWDSCFTQASGAAIFDQLNAEDTAYVRCDHQRRTVYLYGGHEQRVGMRRQLQAALERVYLSRRTLELRGLAFRFAVAGGVQRIHDKYGRESVALNVASRTLEVRESAIDMDDIQQLLRGTAVSVRGSDTTSVGDCPVCFCEVTSPISLPCNHLYCSLCLQQYLQAASQGDQFPVQCIGADGTCKVDIPLTTITKELSPEEEGRLLRSAFLAHIRSRPAEFKFCPTTDCPEVYRAGPMGTLHRCPSCLNAICPACHVEYHEGLDCPSYRDQRTGGEEAFRKWQEEHDVKACPTCNAFIEKIDGCNHMTCAACKAHICWTCMGVFDKNTIYNHMNRVHGSIGIAY
ncbi:hypothetical protein BKA62DRAFT_683096 [Auriculariales sp. MPI-PUGE-AT-0066]|nr:hypothetical protein BKA62DRAFT_683096 [Auriculariales sp. MPI-PUGE-AT-0066]